MRKKFKEYVVIQHLVNVRGVAQLLYVCILAKVKNCNRRKRSGFGTRKYSHYPQENIVV